VPPVRYATADDLDLAYQEVGEGPINLLMLTEWATPLEGRWDVPKIAGPLRRLASFCKIITFDKRGIGLSDRAPIGEVSTPELWVRDTVAVLDHCGVERVVIVGAHEGGQIAALFAASLPGRTDGLILVNTGARLTRAEGYPYGFSPENWRPDLDGVRKLWTEGSGGEPHISATSTDPWWREWYARSRRQQASPRVGVALLRMMGELDVRHVLHSIVAPTLVVHRVENPWWTIDHARYVAENIAEATLVELPGRDNYWWAGDADAVIDQIETFLLGEHRTPSSTRELATLLFTDIIGSTEQAAEMGDNRWRQLLDQHDELTAQLIGRHGGTLIKRLGDGLIATFDGPARALNAASDLLVALAPLGLRVRCAVHTGEIERRGEDVGGIAVHLTARLLEFAREHEIVTTGVVKGLVAGSPLRFVPRGTHELRGIPDSWEVYVLDDSTR
jgi:class 3 adenylate cyclase